MQQGEGTTVGMAGSEDGQAPTAGQDGLLRALVASARQGVVVLDRDLRYLVYNPFMVELRGIPAENVIGQVAGEAFPDLLERGIVDVWRRALAGETVISPDVPHLMPGSGRTVWVSGTCSPIWSASGEVVAALGVIHDITDRKMAELRVQDSEQRYRTLVDKLNVGIFQSTLDGRFLHVNEAVARLAGYDGAEDAGRVWAPEVYVDPTQRGRLLEILLREGRVQDAEIETLKKDGTTYWVSLNMVLLRDSQGNPESLMGALTDITQRRRMEEDLRASEERLRAIIEQAPMAMAIVGMDGTIEYINRRSIENFGYLPEEIPTMDHWWVLAYPDEAYRREVVETWTGLTHQAIAERRAIQGHEFSVTCKDGSVKATFIHGVPVAGKVFVMFEDITERRLAEQRLVDLNQSLERKVEERTRALQRSFEQLENLARQVPGLLFQFQLFPNASVRFPYASEAGRERFELPAPASVENPEGLFDRVHPLDREALKDAIAASARTLEPFHREFRLLRPVQGTCWCSCDASPQRQEDGSVLWHGFVTDISDQKADEDALRLAKDAAESATRAKSLFLANMSHEIRTPMNALLGFLELVLDSPLDDQQRQYLALAQSRSKDLLMLIDDILDLSRIEAGRLTLEAQPFSPAGAVDDVVQMFSRAADRKGLRLVGQVSTSVPSEVIGDVRRMRQVLLNLVGNAIKFTTRGEIVVSVDRASDLEDALHFRVRDTGVGISAEETASIFAPFSQGAAPHVGETGGAGLGLAIARRLAESMGGRLWLESERAVGSTFHFTARLQAQSSAPVPSSDGDEGVGEAPARKILVVDDDATCRYLVECMLKKHGHEICSARDGREALQILALERFDLVLMDVQMPGLDGLSTTRAIRSGGESVLAPDVPIIALTAFAMAGDEEICRAAGANGYLSKPVSARDLAAAVTVIAAR